MPYTIDGTPARLAMFIWIVRRILPGGANSSRKTAVPTPTGIANIATSPSSQRLPTIPTRNPASAGSLDCRFVASAQRKVPSCETFSPMAYQGRADCRPSTAPTIDPSSTESTITPLSVARKQATPKTGPRKVRTRRCGR